MTLIRNGRGANRQAMRKVDHWRQITAELNREYGVGSSDSG
jgi:hypothetical protein